MPSANLSGSSLRSVWSAPPRHGDRGKLVDNRRVDLPADAIALQLTLHIVAEDVLPSESPGPPKHHSKPDQNDRSPIGQVLIGCPPARGQQCNW